MATSQIVSPAAAAAEANCVEAEDWCHTKNKTSWCSFKWTIDDFESCSSKVGHCLRSSIFPSSVYEQKWNLSLYPGGEDESSEDHVSLFLNPHNAVKTDVQTTCTCAILNADGKQIYKVDLTNRFEKNSRNGFGFPMFFERTTLLKKTNPYLTNGSLTLYCEITAVTHEIFSGKNSAGLPPLPVSDSHKIAEDMGQLFESEKLSDVTFVVGDKVIHAHKMMLGARSPVFAAMFEHKMKETQENRVVIEDIDFGVLRELLRFIYTGKVENLEKVAADLFVAADKYGLENLMEVCERSLRATLSKDNATEILVFAHLHNATELKKQTIDFIKTFSADLVNTEPWEKMACSYPALSTEVVRSIVAQPPPQKKAKFGIAGSA